MPRFTLHILAGAAALLSATASHALPFEAQGTIRSITPLANGNMALVCGNLSTVVTPATVVTSPSRTLTLAQLADPTPFPAAGVSPLTGATRAGFIGGSCALIGDDAIVAGQLTVTSLDVDIEENSLVGAVRGGLGFFNILGSRVVPVTDARMSAVRPAAGFFTATGTHPSTGQDASLGLASGLLESGRQQYGFGVDLNSVPANDLSMADGYHGTDGNFHFHTLEVTVGRLVRPEPRPSIQRAACRNNVAGPGDSVEVRGGCVVPVTSASTLVTVQGRLANGTFQNYGTAVCTVDPLAAPANAGYRVGQYRYTNSALTLTNNVCPTSIRASTTQGGVTRHDFLTPDIR